MLNVKNIILVTTFLFYCTATVLFAKTPVNSSYYPLQIGNKWVYEDHNSPHSEELIDTLRVNGILYYGLAPWSPEHIEYWLRDDNGVIKVLNMSDSLEFTLFDFTAQVGASWDLPAGYECTFGSRVTLASITDTVITPVGTFYNCYHFTYLSHCSDGGLDDTWLAQGIGIVRYIEESYFGIIDNKLTALQLNTGVKHKEPSVAASYRLLQNYPNPFNAATIIPYSLGRSGFVTIKLYNVLGREMFSLINNYQDAGTYSETLHADNLPGGIYFYRLEVDMQIIETRKLIYLK